MAQARQWALEALQLTGGTNGARCASWLARLACRGGRSGMVLARRRSLWLLGASGMQKAGWPGMQAPLTQPL